MIIGATLSTLLVCVWWFVRNLFVYGEFTGTAAALRFFAARSVKADFTRPETASNLLHYTLENLCGRFGWNDITLPQEWYHLCNTAALILVCQCSGGNRCARAMAHTEAVTGCRGVAGFTNLSCRWAHPARRLHTI
jgi:hypothetical protein